MVEYMLSLPGILDPEMPDGTTGFAMALARDNATLVEILLAYYQKYPEGRAGERERDIRIAEEAILELDDKSQVNFNISENFRGTASNSPGWKMMCLKSQVFFKSLKCFFQHYILWLREIVLNGCMKREVYFR